MTEKKKRGRPRKVKIEGGLQEVKIIEMSERAKSYQGPAMSVPSEKLYPPDNLSKTEKLAWLTKNRLK